MFYNKIVGRYLMFSSSNVLSKFKQCPGREVQLLWKNIDCAKMLREK